MRRNAVLRLVSGTAGATLAVGLLAAQAPVSRAEASHGQPTGSARVVLAHLIAAERQHRELGSRPAGPVGGVITGFVKSPGGAPFAGACVTATGPTATGLARTVTVASRADGRYVLAGLRPGQYRLRIGACEPAGRQGPVSVFWPHPANAVTLLAGQVRRLSPALAWRSGESQPAAGQPTAQPTVGQPTAQSTRPTATGSISGRVTGGGHPLAHICAVAIPTDFYHRAGPEPHGTTSKTGRYRIRGLRPGGYLVVFRTGIRSCPDDANWLPQWYPYLNSAYPADKAATVRVRAGRDTARIDARLKLGGEITGVVRSQAGKPVRGICVSFFAFAVANGFYSVSVASVSRAGGRYALHGLFPGSYQVQFAIGCGTTGDYAPQWWHGQTSPFSANSVKVSGRRTVSGINATLRPGAAITGTVRAHTARAQPLAGICVDASQNLGDGASAVTAKNGTYRLAGLYGGKVDLSFDPSCSGQVSVGYLPAQRSVRVKPGRTLTGVNASLHLAAGVSGIVVGPGGKPADPCVNVGDRNGDYTFADAKGRYLINGVPPGKYPVFFDSGCDSKGSLAPQWYNNRPDDGSATLVTFTAGKINRINVTLHLGGTLTGLLRNAKGKPVSGDCVGIASPSAQLTLAGYSDQGMTGDDGRYFLNDIPPGEYQVSFGCGYAYPFPNGWFKSQPDPASANNLAINRGVVTTLDQTVGRSGIIKGKVTDKAGRPIPDICVNVANARDGQFATPVDSGAMTDHGRYQVGQLAPGRYLVQFTDCNNFVYGAAWYRGKNSESFATPVTVRAGRATTGINGTLTVGGTISGRVTGPGGKPASDTCVSAANTGLNTGFSFTAADGRYTVSGLSSGRYQVLFYACDTHSPNLASITLPRLIRVIAPRAATGVNVKLAVGGTITGTVTGDSAEPGPQGQACVLAVPTNPDGSYPLVWTDGSGRYTLIGLAAGTYRVNLGDPFCGNAVGLPAVAPQWFSNQPDQRSANLVTVRAGRTVSGVSATLPGYGGIEGTVTSRAGAPVTGECVAAVPFRASADPALGMPPTPDIAITQPTGRFRLFDLTPGRYKIEFTAGCGSAAAGFAPQWWPHATSAKSAQVITVTDTTIKGVNATVRR